MAEMMGRSRLIGYLPQFMQNFAEMKEIMRVADGEADRIHLQMGRTLDEAFIEDCTEFGVRKYEGMLGIPASDGDSLELRRDRASLRWGNEAPYTYRAIVAKLDECCGRGNYDLYGDKGRYEIKVCTHMAEHGKVEEVERLLEHMLPMNMAYDVSNELLRESEATFYVHGVTVRNAYVEVDAQTEALGGMDMAVQCSDALAVHKCVAVE